MATLVFLHSLKVGCLKSLVRKNNYVRTGKYLVHDHYVVGFWLSCKGLHCFVRRVDFRNVHISPLTLKRTFCRAIHDSLCSRVKPVFWSNHTDAYGLIRSIYYDHMMKESITINGSFPLSCSFNKINTLFSIVNHFLSLLFFFSKHECYLAKWWQAAVLRTSLMQHPMTKMTIWNED